MLRECITQNLTCWDKSDFRFGTSILDVFSKDPTCKIAVLRNRRNRQNRLSARNPRKLLSQMWNINVITLPCESYYIIKQKECITLSASKSITLPCDIITLSGSCYIIMHFYYVIKQHITATTTGNALSPQSLPAKHHRHHYYWCSGPIFGRSQIRLNAYLTCAPKRSPALLWRSIDGTRHARYGCPERRAVQNVVLHVKGSRFMSKVKRDVPARS